MRDGDSLRRGEPERGEEWDRFAATVGEQQLQPICVVDDGHGWVCVYGHRRLRAAREAGVWVAAIRASGSPVVLALVENLQRRPLRPAELADALHRAREEFESTAELARAVGLSESYANNLIRIRQKACPALWELFSRHGEGVDWMRLAEVVKLPRSEQERRWNATQRRELQPKRQSRAARLRAELAASTGQRGAYWAGYRDGLRRALARG